MQGPLPPARMKPYRGLPMTLWSAAAAKVRLIVWCKACGHRSEPEPAEQARWYGPETTVPDWRARLVCSRCGSRDSRYGGERGEATVAQADHRVSDQCRSEAAGGSK